MILSIPSLHPYTLALIITVTLLALVFVIFIVIYLYIHRSRRQDDTEVILTEMNVVNSSPNRFSYPLTTVSHANHETFPTQSTLNELPSNYRTFDFTKRSRLHESSDSSYSGSTYRSTPLQSFSFGTIKSKFQESNNSERVSTMPSSDCDDIDTQSFAPVPPTIEYSLIEIFRIELVYKLSYSSDNNELLLQIIRITPMHPLIEHCFPSFSCQIRLFNNDDKHKTKKYLSKQDPINEIFHFDMNEFNLGNSYLKLNVFGQQKMEKRVELGQTVLVMSHHNHLMNRSSHLASEQHTKFIQIYEDRIDMIIRQQNETKHETRALMCLVYENDRCLLHVGLIKIIGIQYLLKQPLSHSHQRDQIQIKICTFIDGKLNGKRKSKLIPITKGICTFSTSFHLDYVSLHKTSIRVTLCYRRSLISAHSKSISTIEFGSTEVKNQQSFQHWTDALSAPNRPHVHWHTLEPLSSKHASE
ncbi:unnamed protein product [Adineta ricciae]|uniref:C2 domain-containing protein n=1 Tax=Adineta ricciae TaxID=249248 RepID=A0A813SHM9_ADIRI|nr:unnamed protein product [Adineta ricciae]CAF0844947.1 unnamed protein product [Adineta ricciae]